MWCIIGLGNPGSKYRNSAHNIGFMFVDYLMKSGGYNNFTEKCDGLLTNGTIDDNKIILFKPQEYMNNSGRPVQKLMQLYKLSPSKLVVFHDCIDLGKMIVRIKIGGGAAGHNGIRSIDEAIGKDYLRVRIGVGRSEIEEQSVSDFVLSRLAANDIEDYNNLFDKMKDNLSLLFSDYNSFSTKINSSKG